MVYLASGRQLPRALPLPLVSASPASASAYSHNALLFRPTPVPLSNYDPSQSARVVSPTRRARLSGERERLWYSPTTSQQLQRTEQWKGPLAATSDALPRQTLVGFRRSGSWFDQTPVPSDDGKEPRDPNRANLGKTLRVLQDRLPMLLQSPLPQDILAPTISLHLFPSTYPHLPTVSGRVAYNAALWTSPIAWNRVPLVGSVRVSVISERVTREPLPFAAPRRAGAVPEQLVVRWQTEGSSERNALDTEGGSDEEFTGLFIFQFDEDGRILSHTIEHAQTGSGWENGLGAKVVGLTDWLLGGLKREGQPSGV